MKSTDSIAVQLEDVSVRYLLARDRVSGLKEYLIRFLQGRIEYEELWAVKGINLAMGRGQMFGVIGVNGAGKTTLLRVVAQVLRPTEGRVIVRGNVAPLLSLGAGFHPELTGRENTMIYGVLLGRKASEIEERLDEITEFSGLGSFLDVPLRMYSSGMWARLGFAVATCMRPDTLLIDEVLAVGDQAFRQKCLDRMSKYRDQGTAILLVTHSLQIVETMCDQAMWLDHGEVLEMGAAEKVAESYRRHVKAVR